MRLFINFATMRVVVQRVSHASVVSDGILTGSIDTGLLVLVGIVDDDNPEDVEWLAKKIVNLRIFDDEAGVMNRSLVEVEGSLLVVSQFTLHALTKKGNRPSYVKAARPDVAVPLYHLFLDRLKSETGKAVQAGVFGADMKVSLLNDGPVTIIIDSKQKE